MAESLNISETKLELIQAVEEKKSSLHQDISTLHRKIDAKEKEIVSYINGIVKKFDAECEQIQTIRKLKNFTIDSKDLGAKYYLDKMPNIETQLEDLVSKVKNSLEIRVNFKQETFETLLDKSFSVTTPDPPDYTKKNDVIWEKVKKGNLRTQLDSPNSITIDTANNYIYVADTKNSRVQVYTDEGEHYFSLLLPETFYPLMVKSNPSKLFVYGFGNDKYYLAVCKRSLGQVPENSGFESFVEVSELVSFDIQHTSKQTTLAPSFASPQSGIVYGYLANKMHVVFSLQTYNNQPSLFGAPAANPQAPLPAPGLGGGMFGGAANPGGGVFGPPAGFEPGAAFGPSTVGFGGGLGAPTGFGGGLGPSTGMGGGFGSSTGMGGGFGSSTGMGGGFGSSTGMGGGVFGPPSGFQPSPSLGLGLGPKAGPGLGFGFGMGGNTNTTTSVFGSKPSETANQIPSLFNVAQQQQGPLFGGGPPTFNFSSSYIKNYICLKSTSLGDHTEAVEMRAVSNGNSQCIIYVLYKQCKYAILAFNLSGVCLRGIVRSDVVKVPHAFCIDAYSNIILLSACGEQKETAATNTIKLDVDSENPTDLTVFSFDASSSKLVHRLTIREDVDTIAGVGVGSDGGIVLLFNDGADEGAMMRKY